jgi:hypothetical protein
VAQLLLRTDSLQERLSVGWVEVGEADPVTVIVHKVRYSKAMRVVRGVWREGQLGAVADVMVKGFLCSPKYGGNRLHLCTQGTKVIRAPGRGCGSTCDPGNTWSRPLARRE